MSKRDENLELRRRVFAAAYARTGRGAESAREAGYKGTAATLAVRACELLKQPLVRQLLAERVERVELSAEKVLAVLGQQMFGSMEDFITIDGDDDPHLDLVKAKAAGRLGLLKKFKERRTTITSGKEDEFVSETVTYEIELYDKQAAAVHIGRILGMFSDGFGDRLKPPRATDSMSDEELLALYLEHRIPRDQWFPAVQRYQAKQIESKVLP